MGQYITRDEEGFERVVLGEVLIPDEVNVYGDFHTRENIREFAYRYMADIGQWYIDRNHDGSDLDNDNGKVIIVESFIARPGDPDFIEGSWVLGSWIRDDEIWGQIMEGELNGYSWEALVAKLPIDVIVPSQRTVYGETEPHKTDGHKHQFFAMLDEDGRVIIGGTSYDEGHFHPLRNHTWTEPAGLDEHIHIYNVVQR